MSVGRRRRPHLICVSKKKRPKTTKRKTDSSESSSSPTPPPKKQSRLFSGKREREYSSSSAFRDEYELDKNGDKFDCIFPIPDCISKNKTRESVESASTRTRKRGEPRDAAKRRRQQHHHHHHRFRRRERKRSETSSCVITAIHTVHVFLCNGFSNRAMRCTQKRRERAHKTFFADPFFSLSFSLSLSSSFFFTCKQHQQQPISTRRRERQIGRRCGDRKMGRKRSRNSIAVERVSQ